METDYISREAAVKAFMNAEELYDPELGNKRFSLTDVEEILNGVEPADVRPVKRGRWNRYEHDRELWANYCSACNIYLPPGLDWEPNFCPNCGADMTGGGTAWMNC